MVEFNAPRHVDVVFCLDATASVWSVFDVVKTLPEKIRARIEEAEV